MSLYQNKKLFLVHDERWVSYWPPASEIGMLLITIFVELRVVAGRSRTLAAPQAVSTAALCRGLEKNGMIIAWHGRGMANVNQTRPHCVNQMGKTNSKPLVARHGRGMAWARHAMCKSALRFSFLFTLHFNNISVARI